MIKLITKVGPQIRVEVQGKDAKEVIAEIGFFSELNARSGGKCGLCDSEHVSFRHRVHSENDFYELCCDDCGGQYAIGQRKDGGLFPRGDKDTGGWSKFEKSEPKRSRDDDRDDRRTSKPAPKRQSSGDGDDW